MLSVILFSLMVWWILWAYTKIQSANIKMANTQEAIQAAESFLEKLNDTSIEYMINTGVYGDAEYVVSTWNRKIIKTKSLALVNKSHPDDNIKFHRGCIKTWCDCKKSPCTIWMQRQWEPKIDLINNDKVTVNDLEFEIYPDQQYVNINITAKNLQWESLYKSGITLSSTIWYKYYSVYPGEITVETLCEDVCSINQVSWNSVLQDVYLNMMHGDDNVTMNSCTLWFWAGHSDTLLWYLWLLLEWNSASESIFQTAKDCKNSYTSWCNNHCSPVNVWNPYNCGYIRYQMLHGFTGTTCDDYNLYVRDYACQDMCEATIFSCLDDGNDNSIIRRTWIKVTSWEYMGKYLQNPKEYIVDDNNTYKKWSWTSTNWWTWCKEYKRYKDWWLWLTDCEYFAWNQYCQCLIQSTCPEVWRKCTNWYYYCDGEYYWGWNNTGVEFLLKDEYDYACIKWKNNTSTTSNYSSKRIVYTPETDPENTLWDCVCEVNYVYSPFAWWFIENGAFAWIQKVDGYTYSESIFMYKQRDYDMIYVDNLVWNERPLDNVKKRLSLESMLNYCNNNELCAKKQTYNGTTSYKGKQYDIVNTWWLRKKTSSINYKLLKCENQEEYNECISTWCCPSPWKIATTYETLLPNFSNTSALEYHCTHYHTWINGEFWIRSGNQCHVINETWCITYASWYEYRPIITGVAIGYYCTGILHNVRDWLNCKEDKWYWCLSTDTKSFWWNTAKEYYCSNKYPGYVYSGTTWWCIKCTSETENYSNYPITENDTIRWYYCTGAIWYYRRCVGWFWCSYKCCSKPSWSSYNTQSINDTSAKAYWCTGNLHYVRDWSNCKQPNGTICTNYDKKQNPSDDDVNKYYCVNNFAWYTWSWWKCTKCTNSGILYSGISINTWTAREKYCTTYLTWLNGINWTHSWDNKCYIYIWDYCANVYTWYKIVTSNTNEARKYYCENKLNWYWEIWNKKCYDKADPTTKCVNFDWYNWNWWTLTDGEYSIYNNYDECVISGKWKNIYKDYTYTCEMSITQQSNSILNIIESLSNLWQTLTWNVIWWLPRRIRWAF